MCDFTSVSGFILAASVAITATVVLIVAAIAANSGFFSAAAAFPLMIAAAVSCGLAASSAIGAGIALRNFNSCVTGTFPATYLCSDYWTALFVAIGILTAVLTGQTVACGLTAGIAAIPWVGTAPMLAITISLAGEMLALGAITFLLSNLRTCVNNASHIELIPLWPVTLLGVVTAIVTIGLGSVLLIARTPPAGSSPTHR